MTTSGAATVETVAEQLADYSGEQTTWTCIAEERGP
jgi:hypothetical protein